MIFLLIFVTIVSVLSTPFVNNPISKKLVGKFDEFSIVLDSDLFGSSDGSRTLVSMQSNEWIKSRVVDPKFVSSQLNHKPNSGIVVGDYFYTRNPSEELLLIIDVSDPTRPILTSSQKIDSMGTEFYVVDDYLYLLYNSVFYIYDVSDKYATESTIISSIPTSMGCQNFYIEGTGTRAYFAHMNGLAIIDISTKSSPVQIGEYYSSGLWGDYVVVDGEFAYVKQSMGVKSFHIVNVSDPSNTTFFSKYEDNNMNYYIVRGNYVFLCAKSDGFKIVNITNRYSPELVLSGFEYITEYKYPSNIDISDDLETVLIVDNNADGLVILDISSGYTSPSLVNIISLPNDENIDSYSRNGDIFYFLNTKIGMHIYSISDFLDPIVLSKFVLCGTDNIIQSIVDGKYWFVIDEKDGQLMFRIYDIEDVKNPHVVGNSDVSDDGSDIYGFDIDFERDLAYVIHHYNILIVNITDRTNPHKISQIMGVNGHNHEGVTHEGNFVFVSMGNDYFPIVNVTDPLNPSIVNDGDKDLDGTYTGGITCSNDYVYLGCRGYCQEHGNSVYILDVSDKKHPELTGILTGLTMPMDVFIDDEHSLLYIADEYSGVRIANVSDKSNPELISVVSTYRAMKIYVESSMIFVADEASGVKIVDATDVFNPVITASFNPDDDPDTITTHVFADENYLFLADRYKGLFIFQTNLELYGKDFSGFCGSTEIVLEAVDGNIDKEKRKENDVVSFSFKVERSEDRCNGHGKCEKDFGCDCDPEFLGDTCESWMCNSIDFKQNKEVCSGHGNCVGPNECECQSTWRGKKCNQNILYATVLAPVASISGVMLFIFLGIIGCMICCFCVLLLILSLCFILMCFCCCSVIILSQSKRLTKFGQLQNFDLLLKEQELDADDSIAHLRINQSLFEISLEEINLIRVLGEGGSNSVVYEAKWKGQIVGFKAFKTRSLCESQESFDEFEREVQILGSVSHPNILRFIGCTLKPPRVGIVMEFCEHGDMNVFLKRNNPYPVHEKLRMCWEIVSALEYLHSRNIIHRDLKLENVLVDSSERTRVMDFGLSRVVDKMDSNSNKTKRIGTNLFMAPEIVLSSSYDEKVDVFSFSIMLYIIFTENWNPYGEDVQNIELNVARDEHFRPQKIQLERSLPEGFEWLLDVVVKCWEHKSSDRYSFEEIAQIFSKNDSSSSFSSYDRRSSKLSSSSSMMEKKEKKEEDIQEQEHLKGKLEEFRRTVDEQKKEIEDLRNNESEKKKEFEEILKKTVESVVKQTKTENIDFSNLNLEQYGIDLSELN